MNKLNHRRGRGLSRTVCLTISFELCFDYMFWAVFWKNPKCETSVKWTVRAFQTDGATWRKARLAKLVLATSTWRRFVELDRSDLDAVWKLRYSGFFMVSVCRATLNRILDAIGSQCKSARTGVMWSRFLAPETTRASVLITLWILPRFPADVP